MDTNQNLNITAKTITVVLYRKQFKDEDAFTEILSALGKDCSESSIILNIPEEEN